MNVSNFRPQVNIRLTDELLAQVDEVAASLGTTSRAQAAQALITRGLASLTPDAPPPPLLFVLTQQAATLAMQLDALATGHSRSQARLLV